MFRKFSLIWLTILVTIIFGLYAKFIYPESSEARQTGADTTLNEAYHLPPEQIEEWLSDYSVEEVQQLVQEHIQKEIENGAEPVYGTISINEDSKEILLNHQEKQIEKEDSTFVERLFEFILNEVSSK